MRVTSTDPIAGTIKGRRHHDPPPPKQEWSWQTVMVGD